MCTPEDAARDDESRASVTESEVSACSQADLLDREPVGGTQDTRSTYVRVRFSRLARLYAIHKCAHGSVISTAVMCQGMSPAVYVLLFVSYVEVPDSGLRYPNPQGKGVQKR